jgi:ABC-type multidrug transport system fused ATPase/permease subunit
LVQSLFLIISTLAALLLLNLRMGLAIVAVIPLLGVVWCRLLPRLRDESRATRRCSTALDAHLRERLGGMAAIKAFARHTVETEKFSELNRDLARRGSRRGFLISQLRAWTTSGITLAGVIALALVGQEFESGRLTAGALVGFYALVGLLLPAVVRVTSAYEHFMEGTTSLTRLLRLLDRDREQQKKSPDLKVTDGEILVQNVSCHLDKKTTLLPNTTLRARRGALTAVVGPDGCGKTTLLELLMLFRPPSKGRILIDGQDITGVSLKSLRSQVGWVAEEPPLFDGTIRQNVAYGLAADTPLEKLQQAAKLAGADQLIDRLPKGWETRVGPEASRLTRGQRRQIALARAMAVNPAVLLIDEPTFSLDPETETLFSQTLRSLARTRTVIVAARRLPSSLVPDQQFTLESIPGTAQRQSHAKTHGVGAKAGAGDSDHCEDED